MIAESKKEKIRNEFVHGYIVGTERVMPTLDYLIKKHNMASSTIYRMSASENWKQQKQNFSEKLIKEFDIQQINRMKLLLGEVE
tara:strand:- start:114 stop:365 length:252 start_codon:yes stop_codon:yes gene_type:complete